MNIYKYPQSKVIDEITFATSENGAKRAYLHAAQGASQDTLQSIMASLAAEGYSIVPIDFHGKPTLEVRGFWKEKSLIDSLSAKNYISGAADIEKEKDTRSFKEKFMSRTLQAASGFFMLADLCFAMYGYKGSRYEDVAAGASYFVGSATMGALGTAAQSQSEIRKQVKKLVSYTKEHNLNFDQNITVPVVTENNKRDVFHKIIDTLQTYPAEIGNSFTSLAGVLIASAALRHRVLNKSLQAEHPTYNADEIKRLRSSGKKDVGLGTSTLISGIIGAFVKEKKVDPDDPQKHGVQALWQFVQAKPLRVAAVGYMVSTFFHTLSTYQDSKLFNKKNDKPMLATLKWRKGFIAFTIIGEVLMALSSKGHGHGVKSDVSTEDSILSIAAEIIAQQKPQMQAELIQNIGNFLGREDVLGGKNTNMQERLAKQVAAMCSNPWVKGTKAANLSGLCAAADNAAIETKALEQQTPEPESRQNAAATRTAKPLPGWTAKVSQPADIQPGLV